MIDLISNWSAAIIAWGDDADNIDDDDEDEEAVGEFIAALEKWKMYFIVAGRHFHNFTLMPMYDYICACLMHFSPSLALSLWKPNLPQPTPFRLYQLTACPSISFSVAAHFTHWWKMVCYNKIISQPNFWGQ